MFWNYYNPRLKQNKDAWRARPIVVRWDKKFDVSLWHWVCPSREVEWEIQLLVLWFPIIFKENAVDEKCEINFSQDLYGDENVLLISY